MILKKIKKNIKNIIDFSKVKPKEKIIIIIGFSGGPDSMALLHVFKQLTLEYKIKIIAAHLNHCWRKEASSDALFCQKTCEALNIPIHITSANKLQLNIRYNGSKEEVGRKNRQFFFKQILEKEKANFIALGHHLQDQQETFFYRILRGCSLSGITAMNLKENIYIRPLLNISKDEILKYLNKNNIKYLIDKTNNSELYLRNRIRKYIIPAMIKSDSRFNKKFQDTLLNLKEIENFLQNLTQTEFNSVFIKNKIGNLKHFLNLNLAIQKRILILWLSKENVQFNPSKNFLNEILRFLNNKNGGKHKLGLNWKIIKKRNLFKIIKEK